ncbi:MULTISPECIES: hypothetical protein [Pseudomonas]|uniref:Uncharacterized protein n=3 Tax=Pseudomonas TaxID=286 RepID=A0ABS0FPV6_PSELU|nr:MULTISPECIES: hypothetical protein [Pseudomonas]MBA1249984.1 hypothetical protein [Pseudomonas zeshuii]MBF8642387.1 hypothetical protein [Pseudomonas zeshuii]MBH3440400.1 hypothetical protein [Pseudomonas luteola]MBW5415154.1 hypothetical protein [Pseudomonas sp. MAG002Y]MDN3237551.1 hypothetical protein [Pseudomonas sp. WAC2]
MQDVLIHVWERIFWVMLWAVRYLPATLAILGIALIVGVKNNHTWWGRVVLLLFGLVTLLVAMTIQILSSSPPA